MPIDNYHYEKMCNQILINNDRHREVSVAVLLEFQKENYEVIDQTCRLGLRAKQTWEFLKVEQLKIPTFYALPKMHKDKPYCQKYWDTCL